MITRRKLTQGTLWNLAGLVLPGLAGIAAMPKLISAYGVERFGVLTVVWLLVGYFGIFDLGLGRALTQMVAGHTGRKDGAPLPTLIWTGLALMLALGLVGGLVLVGVSGLLTEHFLKLTPELRDETQSAFLYVALAVPAVTVSSGLRGVLEARQRFSGVSVARILLGLFTYGGPVVAALFSTSLLPAVVSLVVARYVALVAHAWMCLECMPTLRAQRSVDTRIVSPLLRFGGWMTVSNVISPLMANLDRLLIGAVFAVDVVAFYATPQEVVTRLNVIPSALVTVLFPIFSQGLAQKSKEVGELYVRGLLLTLATMAVSVLFIVCFAEPLIQLWLGAQFVPRSAPVAKWLALGVLLNGLAFLPMAMLHGAGRPDITAKLHLVELPVYVLAFLGLCKLNGLTGAAQAWSLRVSLDALLLLVVARSYLPSSASIAKLSVAVAGTVGFVWAAMFAHTLGVKALFFVVGALAVMGVLRGLVARPSSPAVQAAAEG